MSIDEVKDRLQETYKTRKCDWCHKPCKDYDPKCQCFYCKFPDSYDSIDGDYQNIKNWIMTNLKFYKKLYQKGLVAQNILMRKWHKRQNVLTENWLLLVDCRTIQKRELCFWICKSQRRPDGRVGLHQRRGVD